MTQNGFLANLSRPCHPRYRQQQPAAQILMKYSKPKTIIMTNSFQHKHTHAQANTETEEEEGETGQRHESKYLYQSS